MNLGLIVDPSNMVPTQSNLRSTSMDVTARTSGNYLILRPTVHVTSRPTVANSIRVGTVNQGPFISDHRAVICTLMAKKV